MLGHVSYQCRGNSIVTAAMEQTIIICSAVFRASKHELALELAPTAPGCRRSAAAPEPWRHNCLAWACSRLPADLLCRFRWLNCRWTSMTLTPPRLLQQSQCYIPRLRLFASSAFVLDSALRGGPPAPGLLTAAIACTAAARCHHCRHRHHCQRARPRTTTAPKPNPPRQASAPLPWPSPPSSSGTPPGSPSTASPRQ